MPEVDNEIFYYGGVCAPQDISVMIMMDAENLAMVIMNYRLEDMVGGGQTEWTMMEMSMADDYYETMVYSSDIPGAGMYASAYFQMQFAVMDAEDNIVLMTEIYPDMATLLTCGSGDVPAPSATATDEPADNSGPDATATETPRVSDSTATPRVTPLPTETPRGRG